MDGDKMKKLITHHPSLITNKAGFTLIEALIAVLILAIGLLGVALMQVTTITGNTFSREMSTATTLGQDMLEKLISFDYTATTEDTALIAGPPHPTGADVAANLAPALAGNANNIIDERGLWPGVTPTAGPLLYTRTWTVTDGIDAAPCPLPGDMKCISITVIWNEQGTVPRSITIQGVKVRQ